MKLVEQMTCEEGEAALENFIHHNWITSFDYRRALELKRELKSRRLAQGAG